MAIAVFRSLEGENLEDVASQLFQKWRLGQKSLDNGVLLVVFVEDRKLRLEVGYGLEAALPDAEAAQIIRGAIAPRFREQRYAAGLEAAVIAVYERIKPGSTPAELQRRVAHLRRDPGAPRASRAAPALAGTCPGRHDASPARVPASGHAQDGRAPRRADLSRPRGPAVRGRRRRRHPRASRRSSLAPRARPDGRQAPGERAARGDRARGRGARPRAGRALSAAARRQERAERRGERVVRGATGVLYEHGRAWIGRGNYRPLADPVGRRRAGDSARAEPGASRDEARGEAAAGHRSSRG